MTKAFPIREVAQGMLQVTLGEQPIVFADRGHALLVHAAPLLQAALIDLAGAVGASLNADDFKGVLELANVAVRASRVCSTKQTLEQWLEVEFPDNNDSQYDAQEIRHLFKSYQGSRKGVYSHTGKLKFVSQLQHDLSLTDEQAARLLGIMFLEWEG